MNKGNSLECNRVQQGIGPEETRLTNGGISLLDPLSLFNGE